MTSYINIEENIIQESDSKNHRVVETENISTHKIEMDNDTHSFHEDQQEETDDNFQVFTVEDVARKIEAETRKMIQDSSK